MKWLNLEAYKTFKYSYELETDKGFLNVCANNRAQARKMAEVKGYEVYSVNFTG